MVIQAVICGVIGGSMQSIEINPLFRLSFIDSTTCTHIPATTICIQVGSYFKPHQTSSNGMNTFKSFCFLSTLWLHVTTFSKIYYADKCLGFTVIAFHICNCKSVLCSYFCPNRWSKGRPCLWTSVWAADLPRHSRGHQELPAVLPQDHLWPDWSEGVWTASQSSVQWEYWAEDIRDPRCLWEQVIVALLGRKLVFHFRRDGAVRLWLSTITGLVSMDVHCDLSVPVLHSGTSDENRSKLLHEHHLQTKSQHNRWSLSFCFLL